MIAWKTTIKTCSFQWKRNSEIEIDKQGHKRQHQNQVYFCIDKLVCRLLLNHYRNSCILTSSADFHFYIIIYHFVLSLLCFRSFRFTFIQENIFIIEIVSHIVIPVQHDKMFAVRFVRFHSVFWWMMCEGYKLKLISKHQWFCSQSLSFSPFSLPLPPVGLFIRLFEFFKPVIDFHSKPERILSILGKHIK